MINIEIDQQFVCFLPGIHRTVQPGEVIAVSKNDALPITKRGLGHETEKPVTAVPFDPEPTEPPVAVAAAHAEG